MSRIGRKLSREEIELWARVAKTVDPLEGKVQPNLTDEVPVSPSAKLPVPAPPKKFVKPVKQHVRAPIAAAPAQPQKSEPLGANGLDTGWDRKLARGMVDPDFTLDLHGCTLDSAHGRLLHGMMQARAMGARMVLLVTGKPRPVDPADRMSRRGVIRSKVVDWLAASDLAMDIAAIRGAHRRHGGQGALYIILKRRR